jgi:hypothetical protein
LAHRELDDVLGLTASAVGVLADVRTAGLGRLAAAVGIRAGFGFGLRRRELRRSCRFALPTKLEQRILSQVTSAIRGMSTNPRI